jgi:D-alanine-D-alanine ligase
MDKVAMKAAFDGANIQQAPYIWFYRSDWYAKQATFVGEIETHLKYPIFVKPSRGGSSIGTTCAKTRVELIRAIDLAAQAFRWGKTSRPSRARPIAQPQGRV